MVCSPLRSPKRVWSVRSIENLYRRSGRTIDDRETLLPRRASVKRIGRPLKNGWIAPCKCPVMSLELVHKCTPLTGNTSLLIEQREGAV